MKHNIISYVFKSYSQLTKLGIVIFAVLTAGLAYLLALPDFSYFDLNAFAVFCFAFYFVCSGSFILNQAQEWRRDQKMDRTKNRPIPKGNLSPWLAVVLAGLFLAFGLGLLFLVNTLTALLACLTVILYNVFYTVWWKRRLKYGAVLGAIPGAMPPVIGYSAIENNIFQTPSVYLFLLLFFWQMPHFWSLALYYRKDYEKADFPILPVVSSREITVYHIGLYLLAYLGLALASPLFLRTGLMYLLFLVPLAGILLYQFYKYFYHSSRWLKFFLWVNASVLVYFAVPVLDKGIFHYIINLQIQLAGF